MMIEDKKNGTNDGTVGHGPTDRAEPIFSIKRLGELTLPERRRWSELRSQNPLLYSPYFDIAYCDHVSAIREDSYVVIASRDDKPVAFLPYQSVGKFAAPLGAPMTDYHGVIKSTDEPLDTASMLQAAGIGAFNFNALIDVPAPDSAIPLTVRSEHEAAAIDLSKGAEVWRADHDGSYRRSLKSLRRRVRNTEATYGERRFVFNSKDGKVFNQLMSWKHAQFATTGKYDVLSAGWTTALLERLWNAPQNELHCEMHALYFGERLAAVDFGLTDGLTFHSWMVAYDHEFSNLSPGMQLLEGIIDEASALGYSKIDLGAGTDGYKKNYATESISVKSGFVAVQGLAGKMLSLYGKVEVRGEDKLSDLPGKLRRRYTQIANCDPSFSGRAKAMLSGILSAKK